jgi:hypothetical protein
MVANYSCQCEGSEHWSAASKVDENPKMTTGIVLRIIVTFNFEIHSASHDEC